MTTTHTVDAEKFGSNGRFQAFRDVTINVPSDGNTLFLFITPPMGGVGNHVNLAMSKQAFRELAEHFLALEGYQLPQRAAAES